MINPRLIVAGGAIAIVAFSATMLLFGPGRGLWSDPPVRTSAALDLGVTYLPVTPGVAAYYNLGVQRGALVTEVAPNSLAADMGIKKGDVILSFNGASLEEGVSLLAMMRSCMAGSVVTMDIWDNGERETVQLQHTAG